MRTRELIGVLATGAGPAPRGLAAQRLAPAAAAGGLVAAALAIAVLGLVPASMLGAAALWTKLGYGVLLALAAAWLAARLARPASPTLVPWLVLAAVVAAAALLGVASLMSQPVGARLEHLLGHSWTRCTLRVLVLSLPALAAALWALRGLAPTRPQLAGGAAGLLAGALGALGYALACDEVSLSFVALWYSLGVALTAALGALLGRWVLRW